jgi:4-hydroxyphenylpyruvate dioxygenase-like putative hemolysin
VSQQQEPQFTLPPVYQLGYVVSDIEKACKYYESIFGTGPFSDVIDVNMDGAILRGKPVDTTIKVAFVESGDVQIELIQPVEGRNLYTEFLETRGEGIHHLGYQVEDMEAMKSSPRRSGNLSSTVTWGSWSLPTTTPRKSVD